MYNIVRMQPQELRMEEVERGTKNHFSSARGHRSILRRAQINPPFQLHKQKSIRYFLGHYDNIEIRCRIKITLLTPQFNLASPTYSLFGRRSASEPRLQMLSSP